MYKLQPMQTEKLHKIYAVQKLMISKYPISHASISKNDKNLNQTIIQYSCD